MNSNRLDADGVSLSDDIFVEWEGPETIWIFLDSMTRHVVGYSETGPENARKNEVTLIYRRADLT